MEEQTQPTEGGQSENQERGYEELSRKLDELKDSVTPKEEQPEEEDYSSLTEEDRQSIEKHLDGKYGISNIGHRVAAMEAVNRAPELAKKIAGVVKENGSTLSSSSVETAARELIMDAARNNPALFMGDMDKTVIDQLAWMAAGKASLSPKTGEDAEGETKNSLLSGKRAEIAKEYERFYKRKPTNEEIDEYLKFYGDE